MTTDVEDANAPLLELRGVEKAYRRGPERVQALDGVSISMARGEFVALVGPSGAGKSTMLHLAGGLDVADAGTVLFEGKDIATMTVADRALLRRRRIGFVFQFFHLLPTLSVLENVSLPLLLEGHRGKTRRQQVIGILEQVGLAEMQTRFPSQLSGGEMQRTAVARALVAAPDLVLADEPTGNLDSANGAAVLDLLTTSVRGAGAGMLMVTHDEHAAARADRVLHLSDGHVEER